MSTAVLAVALMIIMSPYLLVRIAIEEWYVFLPMAFYVILAIFLWKWLGKVFEKCGIEDAVKNYYYQKALIWDLVDSEEVIKRRDTGIISTNAHIYKVTSKLHPDDNLYFVPSPGTTLSKKKLHEGLTYAIRRRYGHSDEIQQVETILAYQIE